MIFWWQIQYVCAGLDSKKSSWSCALQFVFKQASGSYCIWRESACFDSSCRYFAGKCRKLAKWPRNDDILAAKISKFQILRMTRWDDNSEFALCVRSYTHCSCNDMFCLLQVCLLTDFWDVIELSGRSDCRKSQKTVYCRLKVYDIFLKLLFWANSLYIIPLLHEYPQIAITISKFCAFLTNLVDKTKGGNSSVNNTENSVRVRWPVLVFLLCSKLQKGHFSTD